MKTYLYPTVFESNRIGEYNIASNIKLRHITAEERRNIFGLNKIEVGFAKPNNARYIKKLTHSKRYSGMFSAKNFFEMPLLISNVSEDILSSNYIIEIDIDNGKSPDFIINDLNLALKLFKLTSTGISVGFEKGFKTGSFSPPSPFHGPFKYLSASKKDIKDISSYYKRISLLKEDAKFKLLKNIFLKSLQGGHFDIELSFLQLTTILETLYLDGEQSELSFKLAMRISKLFNSLKFKKTNETYFTVKDIYKCRSELSHNGCSIKLTDTLFLKTSEIVRLSLIAYLQKPDLFKKNIMEKVCLI